MILEPLSLTESGRPVLLPGEVEHTLLNKVDLVFLGEGGIQGALAEKYKGGRVVVSSHRLMWIDGASDSGARLSCWLPFGSVHSFSYTRSLVGKGPRIKLQVFVTRENRPAPGMEQAFSTIKLSMLCKDGFSDSFQDHLKNALSRKLWLSGIATQKPPADQHSAQRPLTPLNPKALQQLLEMGYNPNRAARALRATNNMINEAIAWLSGHEHDKSLDEPLHLADTPSPQGQARGTGRASRLPMSLQGAGISAVLKKQEEAAQKTEQSLTQAFQDLNALIDKAQEMVKLAERFKSSLVSRGPDQEAPDQETMEEMISMGIVSPVTKENAGNLYHQELSRQLADFIRGPLEKTGGFMTLPDVYCRFNRARGTELVSPDDLLQAASLLNSLGSSIQVRAFASGVTVLQSQSHDDGEVCRKIAHLIGDGRDMAGDLGMALTASDVATAFSIPISLAQQHLLTAECMGVLCRDDGPEGVRFFHNFFKDLPGNI